MAPFQRRAPASPAREDLGEAATAILAVRALEGLGAWILFNRFFLAHDESDRLAAAGFVAYLLLNLLIVLRIRAGQYRPATAWLDHCANIVPLLPAVLFSGGVASPLLLVFPLKIVTHATAFGVTAGSAFAVALAASMVALAIGESVGLLPVRALSSLALPDLVDAVRTSILGFLIASPMVVVLLRRSLARRQPAPSDSVAARREQDSGEAAVANALLMVSEAVSRLTRLAEILEKVVEIAPRSLAVDYCGIALWDEDTGTYTGAVAAGAGPTIDHRFAGVRVAPEEARDFEWVRRLGHCAVVPAESPEMQTVQIPSVLIAPLVSGRRFYGVIQFARKGAGPGFTQRDFKIADGIAHQTAVALERARLIEDSRRLIRALESTGEAILITDFDRRVIFANPAFFQIFGHRPEEVLGRDALGLTGRGEPWVEELVEKARRTGWRGEALVPHKNGTPVPVMLDISLIRDEDGRVQGGVAVIEDISAEKTRQEQMQRAERLAAVGEMAAGIAHEINNALTVIFGQTEWRAEMNAEELQRAMGRVDGQARRIADIVQGVLGFARPRPPQLTEVDLVALSLSTLELVRRDAARQGVEIATTHEPDLPLAFADPQQVQQILLNLFQNALQAMSRSERRCLEIAVTRAGDQLALRVADSGPGVPGEMLSRIFDPFFSTKPDGTGLGLSVSYAIARAHGGDLLVQNEPGAGACFTLKLPVIHRRRADGSRRVLLVDDDLEVAEALSTMLIEEGLEVECATTGSEALEKAGSGAWDAIFLDVRLPDLSGADVFSKLHEAHPEVADKVVFVTGGLWRSESPLRQQLSGQRFLAKPCTQDQVREMLRSLGVPARRAA